MTINPEIPGDGSAFRSMDRMYRYQRYIYDATRKFYLAGRDRLIRDLPVAQGDRVLELGCGTARNLVELAKRHPRAAFFGLDASSEMLRTAARNSGRFPNIMLMTALADDFSYRDFGLDEPFDVCFFSYAVSIIPPWRESVSNALANLKPGGKLLIVDFYDQARLPGWFASLLKWWLGKFHVGYPPELIPFLESIDGIEVKATPLYRHYSILIELTKTG